MGNIKMLNIAAQLASDKPIVMLERPDASLDLEALANLISVLKHDVEQGRTIIVVTHYPKLRELATQVVTVNKSLEAGEAA